MNQVWFVRIKNIGEIAATWNVEKPENGNVTIGLMRDWPNFKLVPSYATILPDDILDVQVCTPGVILYTRLGVIRSNFSSSQV